MDRKEFIKKRIKICLKFMVLTMVISCNGKRTAKKPPVDRSVQMQLLIEAELKTPEEICFQKVKKFVFKESCLECHSSTNPQSDINLEEYDQVIGGNVLLVEPLEPDHSPLYTALQADRGENFVHPPGTHEPLLKSQAELVYQWIKYGAKELPHETVDETKTVENQLQPYFDNPETIDYQAIKKHVFEPGACLKCHSEESSGAINKAIILGADMTDYKSLFYNSGIVPGVPYDQTQVIRGANVISMKQGSRIFKSIAKHEMPPKNSGYAPLSPHRVELLKMWIGNCAPEEAHYDTSDFVEEEVQNFKACI